MTLTNRPKAYSYLRFSTPEQERGDSFRRQTQLAADYAARHELDLDTELTFQDLGMSAYRGANAETGRLADFLEAVRAGAIPRGSYLLVESLDRLSRNKPRKAVRVLESICDAGIALVTLSGEPKVYTADMLDDDPMAFMWAFMVAIRANEESATKSRRVKAAWERKRATAKDKVLTARAPTWLRLVTVNGERQFEVIEEKAAVVRRIFGMTLQGIGHNKIAETLNREGVPVFDRGKQWHKTFIAKLLAYEGVIGIYAPHTVEYQEGKKRRKPADKVPGYYPAIVAENVFHDAQARLAAKAPRGRHVTTGAPIRNIFAGLAQCPSCGSTVTLVSKNKRDRYLVCTKAKAGAGCTYKAVRYGHIESAVLLNTGAWAGPGLDEATDNPHGAALATAREHVAALSSGIDEILTSFGSRGSAAATAKVREMEAEREKLEREIAGLERRAAEANGPLIETRIAAVLRATREGDTAGINGAFKVALEKVVVDYTRGEVLFHWRHGPVTAYDYAPFADAAE